ncbi:MAG TPA: hypothetical protein VD710_03800 [Nitrososphaeraceae archaeon]|nr:hypothetical protein [Nitrososphaeraceae archaeon]
MNKELYIGTVTLVFAFALIYVPIGYAQNLTTNASNAVGNMTASANQTASELGQNATEIGGDILNKTGEGVKGFLGGAADVVSNISEEVKEGVGK